MFLSRRCEYALRAMIYLAGRPAGSLHTLHDLSDTLGLPHAFLAKAMRDLAEAGIVASQPGTGGGVALGRSAGEIRLKEIVLALDGPDLFETCVLRLPGCGADKPCPLHHDWVQARRRIERMLSTVTLADVTAGAGSDVRALLAEAAP